MNALIYLFEINWRFRVKVPVHVGDVTGGVSRRHEQHQGSIIVRESLVLLVFSLGFN